MYAVAITELVPRSYRIALVEFMQNLEGCTREDTSSFLPSL